MDLDTLRTTAILDSEGVANKSRFGLFSQPLSNAIGDDGPYKTKLHPRQQSGKPITSPRGIFTNPTKNGQLANTYFGKINSLAQKQDEYIDPGRKQLQIQNQTFYKGYNKQQSFKPASNIKQLHQPSYQYKLVPNPELNPKRNRQEDGRVKAKPRNIYTNLQSTVIRSFFKPIKYMEDPFDRSHQIQSQKLKKDKDKQHQSAFRPNSFSFNLFNSHKNVYGLDVQLKPKTQRQIHFNIYKHETRWKDTNQNRSGIYGTFQPFPKYIENPLKQHQRRVISKQKQSFKRMSIPKSKPSPSIAMKNISKSKMYKSFSLRK